MENNPTYYRLLIHLTDAEAASVELAIRTVFDHPEKKMTSTGYRFRHRSDSLELVVETQDGGAVWDLDLEARVEEPRFFEMVQQTRKALDEAGIRYMGTYVLMDEDDEPIGEEMDLPELEVEG